MRSVSLDFDRLVWPGLSQATSVTSDHTLYNEGQFTTAHQIPEPQVPVVSTPTDPKVEE